MSQIRSIFLKTVFYEFAEMILRKPKSWWGKPKIPRKYRENGDMCNKNDPNTKVFLRSLEVLKIKCDADFCWVIYATFY